MSAIKIQPVPTVVVLDSPVGMQRWRTAAAACMAARAREHLEASATAITDTVYARSSSRPISEWHVL
jgi:hypothetical protein